MLTFYYQPVNWIKVAAVWVCDTINKLYDPFEFNTDLPVCDSLNNLDKKFGDEIDAEFMMPSGEFLYQHPRPNDAGDTAIWHGICTGMKILRNNDVTAPLHFLKSLFVNNALIRGYHYGTNLPNDTTSNDSATGPLFAFYCALRFGDESTKADAGALLLPWVKNLKEHNWALVDQTGVPTPFGKLENGIIMTDPLRITQLLAILSLAMAYDPAYGKDYEYLYAKHKPILAYPKVKLLWMDTSYDTHRAAINLHILYWMTRDEVYRKGLQRIWRISKKSNNAWVDTLCSEAFEFDKLMPIALRIEAILKTFDYQIRQFGNMQTTNEGWPSVKWGSKMRAKKPLPLNKRGSQDFFWQRHPFSLAEWVGVTHPDTFHSGLDFLVCLHLARKLGMRV